jgi:hypothetical protein
VRVRVLVRMFAPLAGKTKSSENAVVPLSEISLYKLVKLLQDPLYDVLAFRESVT